MKYLNPQRYLFLWVAALMLLAACANNPAKVIREACDPGSLPEVCAFGIYESYTALVEQAAALKEDPDTAPELVGAMQAFEKHSTPTMKALRDVAREVEKARKAYAAGTGTVEKLVIVSRELPGWITKGTDIVNRFKAIVRGG